MHVFILERYSTGERVSIRTRLRQDGSRVFDYKEQTGVGLALSPPRHVFELAAQGTNGIGARLERSIAVLHGDRRRMCENPLRRRSARQQRLPLTAHRQPAALLHDQLVLEHSPART